MFRFEGAHTVEHWDNIQPRLGPNASGHTMLDGPTEVQDIELTEENRKLVGEFVREVLIEGQGERLEAYLSPEGFTEHSPEREDGPDALRTALERSVAGRPAIVYARLHRVLAEGNFVLTVSEGQHEGVHTAFYDLYRVADGKLAEHWDTIEAVAPTSEWKHENGKF